MTFRNEHVVASHEQLRTLYRDASQLVIDKERPTIDAATREFITKAPFVAIGTVGADGTADVSPRGGPSGFVQVLDDAHIAIADLSGNNRLDTLENIVANGEVGLLFIVPGQTETVRLNGVGFVTTDPDILGGFSAELKVPKAAIVVEVVGTFIHCAKAMQRSHIWQPETWAQYVGVPDAAEIIVAQGLLPAEVTAGMVRVDLDRGYEYDIVNERANAQS